jgi:O-antigen ligase
MASDVLRPVAALPSSERRWIGEALFVGFLLLAFIGITPFKSEPLATEVGVVVQTGAGDSLRQICYLAVFALLVFAAVRQRGAEIFSTLPLVLLGLLGWCVASALWSPDPMVTIRRAGLATVLVVSAFLSVETVGSQRSLVLWRWVLLAVLVINLVSIKIVPAAVHQFGEVDPQLVGNWRGIYGHKNIAGAVAAMTALIFLFMPGRRFWGKLFDLVVVALAVVFLIGTHSKSSMGLLAVAVAAAVAYRFAWRQEIDRTIALVAIGLLLVATVVFAVADQTAIGRMLEDPTQFTGRTEIWNAEIAHIRDHPVLGSGFGTFAGTGKMSPLAPYISGWVIGASNGHNGFLQLLVTVGGVGFALAFIAFLVTPVASFWRRGHIGVKALLFSLFVFLVLHNLMETDFLEGDGVTWVGFLLMLAMLRHMERIEL